MMMISSEACRESYQKIRGVLYTMSDKSTEKRFVVDCMLGKLVKWLRILGFDCRYLRLVGQDQIDIFKREGFLLISRNRRWCGQTRFFCPNSNDPVEQLRQIVEGIPISPDEVRLLRRCVLCNQLIEKIPRNQATGFVPEYVFETNATFFRCPTCGRLYWPGSHSKRMMARIHYILGWSPKGYIRQTTVSVQGNVE